MPGCWIAIKGEAVRIASPGREAEPASRSAERAGFPPALRIRKLGVGICRVLT